MDYFAVVSLGAYPTPTPTDAARAAYFASWGLLGTAPSMANRRWGSVRMIFKMRA